MKKIMCLFVVFLISNAANAADKWEYCSIKCGDVTARSHGDVGKPIKCWVNISLPKTSKGFVNTINGRFGIYWTVNYGMVNGMHPDERKGDKEFLKSIKSQQATLLEQKIAYLIQNERTDRNELINAFGKSGWELVNAVSRTDDSDGSNMGISCIIVKSFRNTIHEFYFKRKISK